MAGPIIALGGGGFLMATGRSSLDDYILSRARVPSPRICFVPTAGGESATQLVKFYRAFAERDCTATDLTLYHGPVPRRPSSSGELADFVSRQDILYVGGGNTANLLATWRAHGLDRILRDAWLGGTLLCGVSAGMICWFSASVTDSFGPLDRLDDGLGLLPGSACPHYDGEAERRPRYHALVGEGLPAGYAADDGAALVFDGTELAEVVTERREAAAYRVELREGVVVEERLSTRYLGS